MVNNEGGFTMEMMKNQKGSLEPQGRREAEILKESERVFCYDICCIFHL